MARAMPVRAMRFSKARLRRRKLRALKYAAPNVAAKVFVCGIIPSLTYDSAVYGLFGAPFAKLRQETGVMLGLLGKGRSRDLAFAFEPDKDPKISCTIPVAKRYCEEVYNSALPPCARRPAGIPLGILAQGVARFLRERPGTPQRAEGPLSALMMALDKAGWRAAGPFEFI